MALVLGPILVIGSLLGLVLRVFGEHDYPAGDIRNEPLFWFVFGGAILAVNVYVAVGNLRARAWRPGPPTAYRDAAPSNPDAPGGVSRSEQ